tara:strand:- start:1694 stop:2317 length:624 start_codon:yes stop_codon:yes gene_type:complete
MKKINYFDLGLHRGQELSWMVNDIFPSIHVDDYWCYGFEACSKHFNYCKKKFMCVPKISLFNKAIASTDENQRLYYAKNGVGHSIFKTKMNVDPSKFETVSGLRFATWLYALYPDLGDEKYFNILKVNIEGAEWYLFRDLISMGMLEHFDIICGPTKMDVRKIGELHTKEAEFDKLVKDIPYYRFTELAPEKNVNMKELIQLKLNGG